jgi:hypothetical protein
VAIEPIFGRGAQNANLYVCDFSRRGNPYGFIRGAQAGAVTGDPMNRKTD